MNAQNVNPFNAVEFAPVSVDFRLPSIADFMVNDYTVDCLYHRRLAVDSGTIAVDTDNRQLRLPSPESGAIVPSMVATDKCNRIGDSVYMEDLQAWVSVKSYAEIMREDDDAIFYDGGYYQEYYQVTPDILQLIECSQLWRNECTFGGSMHSPDVGNWIPVSQESEAFPDRWYSAGFGESVDEELRDQLRSELKTEVERYCEMLGDDMAEREGELDNMVEMYGHCLGDDSIRYRCGDEIESAIEQYLGDNRPQLSNNEREKLFDMVVDILDDSSQVECGYATGGEYSNNPFDFPLDSIGGGEGEYEIELDEYFADAIRQRLDDEYGELTNDDNLLEEIKSVVNCRYNCIQIYYYTGTTLHAGYHTETVDSVIRLAIFRLLQSQSGNLPNSDKVSIGYGNFVDCSVANEPEIIQSVDEVTIVSSKQDTSIIYTTYKNIPVSIVQMVTIRQNYRKAVRTGATVFATPWGKGQIGHNRVTIGCHDWDRIEFNRIVSMVSPIENFDDGLYYRYYPNGGYRLSINPIDENATDASLSVAGCQTLTIDR